jgi:anti-anti-sigma factor
MPKHLNSRTEQGVLVLTVTAPQVRGDDLADELRDEMLAELAAAGTARVAVDMSAVSFMSSVAFRPLLRLQKTVAEKGGRVVLCGLQPPVAEVFHLTRLISTSRAFTAPFEGQPDVQAAIASLKS